MQLVTGLSNGTVMYTSYGKDGNRELRKNAMLNCVNKTYRGNVYFAGPSCIDDCGDKFRHDR